ncbi:hypothetical protein CCO03_12295 [Comamonas serinivorans]|uniref:Uncharacterized protein n=1 Tax=Comamonas serinivorans TaxID=1082851 RepID=A0A1Y0EQ32_9BURK|nr:hypothetical protein [Comamonas serinivorans]ARU05362.1 hypothetical protein CCO03_12295 [Comamonas serinivorans]
MNTLRHPIFGELPRQNGHTAFADALWTGQVQLAAQAVPVHLRAGDHALDLPLLDQLAAHRHQLPQLDATARQHLRAHLDANRDDIDFHVDEAPRQRPDLDGSFVQTLAPSGQGAAVATDDFVQALRLNAVSLSCAGLCLDDVIGLGLQGIADQILAVRFTAQGAFLHVSEES